MVFVGYVLACIAASIVLAIGTLTPQWDDLLSLGLQHRRCYVVGGRQSAPLIIVVVAMLPALLVIVVAEGFALAFGRGLCACLAACWRWR